MDLENRYGVLAAQKDLLVLLKEFHSFCVEHEIKYSLSYGSLLGAIRHQGFIPWDDDLDVFVDRKNADLLNRALADSDLLQVERESAESLWVDRVRQKNSPNRAAADFVPTLDILVLDNVPEGGFARALKMFLILTLQGMIKQRLTLGKGSIVLKACSILTYGLGKLFPLKWKKRWYRRVSQWGNACPTPFVANYNGEFADLRRQYPCDMMDRIVEHRFEDTEAFIVADYDKCLKIQFGDYMILPDEKDRKPAHGA